MSESERESLKTELMRAQEAVEACMGFAPLGLATQWAGLALVRVKAAREIVEGKNG